MALFSAARSVQPQHSQSHMQIIIDRDSISVPDERAVSAASATGLQKFQIHLPGDGRRVQLDRFGFTIVQLNDDHSLRIPGGLPDEPIDSA